MARTTTTELYTWLDVLYHQCESLALHLIGTNRLNALHLDACISWGLKVSRLFCFCCRFHVQGTDIQPIFIRACPGATGSLLDPLGRHPCRMCCWPTPDPFEMSAIMQHLELLVNANYVLESNRGRMEGDQAAEWDATGDAPLWLHSRELCECALTILFPIWLTFFFFFFF